MPKLKIPSAPSLTTLQSNAAGADIGAREIYVAVPPERSTPSVRCFGTFTISCARWSRGYVFPAGLRS